METSNFSVLQRHTHTERLANTTFDLAVIGGGITGVGIALDAVSRGLNVCLVEKHDFASGTSNKSTKLIHGGLRYLKNFEIGLVRESGRERAIVHELAPHLVTPQKMLLPLVKGGTYGKFMTAIGLRVYDLLAGVRGADKRKMLDKTETLAKEPLLTESTLLGGGLYAEYRTDDARLVIEIAKKASALGATLLNYCEVTGFEYDAHSKLEGLTCTDLITNTTTSIKAKHYVSAAGPWVDRIRAKDNATYKKRLQLTKGVHLVFPFEKLPVAQAIYFDIADGRMAFAIPRGKVTYVGTTDTPYNGDLDRIAVTKADATYILKAINQTFTTVNLNIEDIESNWAGLRPLIHQENKSASELSRKDEIFNSKSGLISIAGGKLTGYRKMAHRVLDVVLKKEPQADRFRASVTEDLTLVEPHLKTTEAVKKYQDSITKTLSAFGLSDPYQAWYLCATYGQQADAIIAKAKTLNTAPAEALIRAELWYAVHFEMVTNLVDFFVRRTGRLFFDIESVHAYQDIISQDLSVYLNWSEMQLSNEKEALQKALDDATTYYDDEF